MTAPIHSHRAKDPSPREIERRAARVRRRWSDDVEESRRVEKCAPIIFAPLAPQDIGLSQEPIETPV